jgi:MFS family permease
LQLIKAGWRATVGDRPALVAVIRLSLSGVVIALVSAVVPNFVVQVLHQPAEDVSLVLAPAGIALIVGAVLAPRIARRMGQLPAAGLGVNGVALGVALLALNRPLGDAAHFSDGIIIALAVLEASLLGFSLNLISIPCQTVIQERVLPDLRGQALAFQQALQNLAAAPVLLLVGFLADTAGIAWALLVVAVGVVCAARIQLPVKPKPPAQVEVVTSPDTLVS